jgi:integrase
MKDLKTHRLRTPGEVMFPLDPRNFRSRVWHPALHRAGLRAIRIHDARHTHASLLIAAGADVVAVSRRLGHANPNITLTTYSHLFKRSDSVRRKHAGNHVICATATAIVVRRGWTPGESR